MDIKKIGEELKNRISVPVIMLVAALLIAGIVSFWSYGLLQKRTAVKAILTETQPVVVAAFNLDGGTVITKDVVKTEPYMKGSLPTGYIASPSAAIGRVVTYPIRVNEPITESRLAPVKGTMGGLSAMITPKKRAMAVKVDKVVGVSGFIHPGNRVDVIVSLNESDKESKAITKIVLENIPVLAVGNEVEQPAGKNEKATTVDVITLEVTSEEGEKLALVATQGKLQLALRNSTDTEDVLTQGTTLPKLLASYTSPVKKEINAPIHRVTRKAQARMATPGAEPVRTFTVEIIKGNKVSEEKFY
ncbi:MAG: Flp pilus assembly protein CpaB [Syntrophales bacterium]|jgi:pilus assembly protein CpaB